ncbi:MAG TPA: putative Ig domain-containing protein, partial [Jatrophihabitans sp.]|nr:putative Ig domain-containing protein [Jatrophihabitans sp.]
AVTTLTKSGSLPAGVSFTDNGDGTATLAGTPGIGTGGIYTLTITATNGVAPAATQAFTLTVNEPPHIVSADHATFSFGAAGAFTVSTAGGQPSAITITETGTLPAGVSFTDNGDGTATLGGTPAAGGTFPITITASNGVLPNATQSFTLTVSQTPAITSADHTTFAVGSGGSFTVTTTPGTPAATTLTETGALPSGVTFHDNGDGTATLAGTPAASSGQVYSLSITASNSSGSVSQTFTLTVNELPAFTSPAAKTFVVGTAGSFTVTTTAGYPAARTITETGTLPSGLSFTDNGDGTATLAGTPAAGQGNSYPLTLTATNAAGHTDQAFTLTVAETSAFSSADHTTFTAGSAGSFTVSTAGGFPTPPALTEAGALPSGISFADNGDGTATLAGTATTGGVYSLTFTAGNGAAPDATQVFTLTVDGPPAITSANRASFTQGVAGSFTVTTQAGVPASPVTLTATGPLPAGVSFHDNGDGTATLAGSATQSGDFTLTVTASNGVAPDASQSLTVTVAPAAAVVLSAVLPASAGTLNGVPGHAAVGQVLHLNGSGFASGATVTIGIYSSPAVLAHVNANASGAFAATITVPDRLGRHTFVAAGAGPDGHPRYLETATVISAAASGGGTGGAGSTSSGGGLANTGPDTDPRATAGWALTIALFGFGLTVAARRRKRSS